MKPIKPISRVALVVASLSMILAYFVPLWRILLWAPQYPEGLEMKIWINTLGGDVKIISALNHYIGMRHIEVGMFPELSYMVYIVGAMIAFGLVSALWGARFMLVAFLSIIVAAGIAALVDFYIWGYDYGHNLDPTAAIKVEGMTYQPPLIGTKVLLNFTAYSGPDVGGWVFIGVGIALLAILIFEIKTNR